LHIGPAKEGNEKMFYQTGDQIGITLVRIEIEDFKRIRKLSIRLSPITAIVGGNTSGKSSALQAAQLGISIIQAITKPDPMTGADPFLKSVPNDAVLYRPTENLLDLRRGAAASQKKGYSISYFGVKSNGEEKQIKIVIMRGKNANLSIKREGDDCFAATLASRDKPFAILSPGLSGIPLREE